MTFRLLVTGSRTWTDAATIHDAITGIAAQQRGDIVLVHGACPRGADRIADDFAHEIGLLVERHPANWGRCADDCRPGHRKQGPAGEYCPTAGHRRNQDMVDTGADYALVFMRGRSWGTADCLRRIHVAGIPFGRWTA